MARFEDVGFEESYGITFTFCEDDYNFLKKSAEKKGQTIKEYVLDVMETDHKMELNRERARDLS